MDRKGRIAALVIVSLFVGHLLSTPTPDLTGHFEIELSGTCSAGTSEPELEVRQHAEVDVTRRGNSLVVQFEVTREAPYWRYLEAGADAIQEGDSLRFVFGDNWSNSGRGRFSKVGDQYVLDLECLGGESQGHVGMLYGEHEVLKKRHHAARRVQLLPESISARY